MAAPSLGLAETREALILAHMPQVTLLARRQHRRCPQVELEDLISVGTIGLIQALDRFDPNRGLKLKTLAEHRIRGALLDYLRCIDPLPRSVDRSRNSSTLSLLNAPIAARSPAPKQSSVHLESRLSDTSSGR